MGCNSTKNLAVEPFNGHVSDNNTQARRPFTGHTSNIPPLEAEDLQEELLENATVNNVHRAGKMAFVLHVLYLMSSYCYFQSF
nr:unnamed protein product [Callosobruchus chinensis]